MSTLARSRPARWALAPISLAVLVVSCSAPRYEYVRNTSLRTAFKIPHEWELFDRETILGLPPGPQPSTPDPIRWLVGFDGDPQPSVSHVLDPTTLNTDHPQGVALVQRFSFDDRDTSSYNSLRNSLFPVDALLRDANSARVLSYDDSIDNDGVRGVHIVFQFRASSLASAEASVAQTAESASAAADLQRTLLGGAHAALLSPDYVTVDQMAFVDADSSQVYLIAVLCSAACYQRNGSDISSIVDSWTVLP